MEFEERRWRLFSGNEAENGGQLHRLAVSRPPFRFAEVACRKRKLFFGDRHRDCDEITGLALGAVACLIAHDSHIFEVPEA